MMNLKTDVVCLNCAASCLR